MNTVRYSSVEQFRLLERMTPEQREQLNQTTLHMDDKLNDFSRFNGYLTRGSYWMTRDFHEAFGFPIYGQVQLSPSVSDRERRLHMLLEEFKETIAAMGFTLTQDGNPVDMDTIGIEHVEGSRYCPVETADGFADMKVIIDGSACELGIPQPLIDLEVFYSNMTKLDADGKPILNGLSDGYRPQESGYREDQPIGKGLKGPNYQKPNIAKILFDHIGSESK